ncbi:MAG: T9SS type A sorting domain-containing protein [Bacteroidia bacterium]|nr:T9SS type A sorting domain-containing protein [Bacteroidia bacterium]
MNFLKSLLFIIAILCLHFTSAQTPISISFDLLRGGGVCNRNGGVTTNSPSGEPSNHAGLTLPGQTGSWNTLRVGGGQLNNCCTTSPSITVSGITFSLNTTNKSYETFQSNGNDLLRKTVVFFRANNNVSCNATPDGPPDQSMEWEFTGLDPTKAYDIIFFGQDQNGGPANPADFSILGHDAGNGSGNPVSLDAENDGNFMTVVPDPSGKISGTFSIQTGASFSAWSGLQIQESSNLPVELIHFEAVSTNKSILLEWETAFEVNNKGFSIERSIDSKLWTSLQFVPGKGNSDTDQNYSFVDVSPIGGNNYYRIKQIDFNGSFTYSRIIMAKHEPLQNYIQVFPNPSNGVIKFQVDNVSSEKLNLYISDSFGRKIWESPSLHCAVGRPQQITIDGHGVYVITAQIGEEIYYKRVLIRRE